MNRTIVVSQSGDFEVAKQALTPMEEQILGVLVGGVTLTELEIRCRADTCSQVDQQVFAGTLPLLVEKGLIEREDIGTMVMYHITRKGSELYWK